MGWVSGTATIAGFLEPFYGLYWCMPREKEGRFWVEAGAHICLVKATRWKCGDGGVASCSWTDVAGWYLLLVAVWNLLEICLLGKLSRLPTAKPGTWRPGNPHGSRMGYLPWLMSYRLLRLNLGAGGEHLTSQLSWIAAWLLVTRVCPVYLVDELALLCCKPLWLG